MPEVEKGEIDKVEDEHYLSKEETRVHPEEHESELQKVVDDEVRADVRGKGLLGGGGGEEGGEVVDLRYDEDDPVVGIWLASRWTCLWEGGRRGR